MLSSLIYMQIHFYRETVYYTNKYLINLAYYIHEIIIQKKIKELYNL